MSPTEKRLIKVEKELEAVKARNVRVEGDKAWEVSNFRLSVLSLITFGLSLVILYLVRTEEYFLSALGSTIGLIISAQSLPVIKKWWLRHRYFKEPLPHSKEQTKQD